MSPDNTNNTREVKSATQNQNQIKSKSNQAVAQYQNHDSNTSNTNITVTGAPREPPNNPSITNNSPSLAASAVNNLNAYVNATASASIQLPTLNIQKFEGQCEQFNTFYESFKSIIHNYEILPVISKFLYLKIVLETEPKRVIEHLDLLEGNYDMALLLLECRYKDVKHMIHTHVWAIMDCPVVNKNNPTRCAS